MKHVQIKGFNHYFDDINSGKEEAILLVHGHPFDHSMWNYQIEVLSNFRI